MLHGFSEMLLYSIAMRRRSGSLPELLEGVRVGCLPAAVVHSKAAWWIVQRSQDRIDDNEAAVGRNSKEPGR